MFCKCTTALRIHTTKSPFITLKSDEHNSRSFGCGSAFKERGLCRMKAHTSEDTHEGCLKYDHLFIYFRTVFRNMGFNIQGGFFLWVYWFLRFWHNVHLCKHRKICKLYKVTYVTKKKKNQTWTQAHAVRLEWETDGTGSASILCNGNTILHLNSKNIYIYIYTIGSIFNLQPISKRSSCTSGLGNIQMTPQRNTGTWKENE